MHFTWGEGTPTVSFVEGHMSKGETITAYKGFDKDWSCRGFQYEVGKTYTHDGDVSLCCAGFHACEVPFDVWSYYPLGAGGQYAQVQLGGVSAETDGDSKRVGRSLTVKAALSIPLLVKAQVEWTITHADAPAATGDGGHAAATGRRGHAAATGYGGHAAATGYGGHAAATGDGGHAAATGYGGHAAATGSYGHAAATGSYGHAAATGSYGHAAATGYGGHAAATGSYGHAAATGDGGAALAGFSGRARASATGAFAICWYDAKAQRTRLVVGTPGENGVKSDTWYCVEDGQLREVSDDTA